MTLRQTAKQLRAFQDAFVLPPVQPFAFALRWNYNRVVVQTGVVSQLTMGGLGG